MSIMDLKHKGITWVGNFFQKLEAVCQEVDDLVSKDTVKYVENQLQTMGGSVKKFYSDVVQDVLPPLVDPVKQEAQGVALKSNDASSTYLKSILSDEETGVDAVIKQSHVEHNAVDHVKNQLPDESSRLHLVNHIIPTSVDALEEAETESSLEKGDDVLTNENPYVDIEENAIEDLATEVLELTSPGYKESFEALSGFSVVSGEKTIAETRPLLASSSLLAESSSLSGKSLDNSLNELSYNNPGDHICDSSSKLSFSIPTPIVSCEKKALELGHGSSSSILSLKSLEENTSRIKEILTLTESSENRHIHVFESAQGHSCDLDNDVTDPSMETIELSDKVKLEESCVIVEPSELYAVARRARKLRSYRKKIQDAFTSRKRLAEEYEQLAIWYGDADMGSGIDKWQPSLPPTPATPLDMKDSQTQLTCDSEWELL